MASKRGNVETLFKKAHQAQRACESLWRFGDVLLKQKSIRRILAEDIADFFMKRASSSLKTSTKLLGTSNLQQKLHKLEF
jgi:hypothetical protein